MAEFMSEEAYKATLAALVAAHPEDFVNLIIKSMMDRTDVADAGNEREWFGDITVPAMGDGEKARKFIIGLSSKELEPVEHSTHPAHDSCNTRCRRWGMN